MTLQRRDTLYYGHIRFALNRDILEGYFDRHPSHKPKKTGFQSDLYRGYFSEYEIVERKLYVKDIWVPVDYDMERGEELRKSVIASTFPKERLCTWFSGQLLMFSMEKDDKRGNQYLSMQVKEGRIETIENLSEQEYDDMGNHAYDYF